MRSLSGRFAETPPPRSTRGHPTSRTARRVLRTRTSTTASWKLAATSARLDSSSPAAANRSTSRLTAVFRPLNDTS